MTEFLLMAAPLEDNTDSALRALFHRHGADLTFTEMTRVNALARGNKSTWDRLEAPDGSPYEIQLLPSSEEELEKFLGEFKPLPCFKGFNFNFGCPSPKVIKDGMGSAMMKRIAKIQRLIDIVRKYNHPISIKFRLGLNQFEKESKAYLKLIEGTTPDYFIVHLRHAGQKYSKPADWSLVPEIIEFAKEREKKVVINGDIYKKEQVDYLKELGAYGAMIGRAAVYDPSVFNKLKGLEGTPIDNLRQEYIELTAKYGNHPRFPKNVLKRMGRDSSSIDSNLLV